MTLKMKLVTAILVALVMSVATAQAQTVKASIPFKFRAGETVLAAGEYTIQFARSMSWVAISPVDASGGAYVPIKVPFESKPGKGSLVFHKYGSAYFLYRVTPTGQGGGWEMPQSRAEKEAAKAASNREYASVEIPLS